MNEDMDRVLAYRNFLAAEDHLDELLLKAASLDEKNFLTAMKNNIVFMRDDIMPKESDSKYHCLVKHLATAYEACREVAKASLDDLDVYRVNTCQTMLLEALERLWGRKIITCERCGVKEENESGRVQEEGSRDSVETSDGGLSRVSLQRVSDN